MFSEHWGQYSKIFKLFIRVSYPLHRSWKPELFVFYYIAGQNLGMGTKKTEVSIQSNFPVKIKDP